MAKHSISLSVNGRSHQVDVDERELLVYHLRESLGLTGTHIGCDTSYCGACTILVNDLPVKSCTMLAVQADGKNIRTVESLEKDGNLSALQEAFSKEHGLQCGYCTPGMLMSATHLLETNPNPTEYEIRRGISGNLCRCTGYNNIIKAISSAAENS